MMSEASRVEAQMKTMDIINRYEAGYPGVKELKTELLSRKAIDAEALYFALLARILNSESTFLPPEIRTLPLEVLNAGMHYLHLANGDQIRTRAIRKIGEYDACVLFKNYNVGVRCFPEKLNPIVEKLTVVSKKYADVYFETSTTWINHHDDWGTLYFYQENEFPCIRVRSVSEEARNLFIEELISLCEEAGEVISISLYGPKDPDTEEIYLS